MIILKILLTVLKWIFLFLLFLLLLFICLLLLCLLVPVRYRGEFHKTEEEKNNVRGRLLLSWLNPVLRIRVQYENEKAFYSVRFFGFCLLGSDKKKRPKKEKKKKSSKKQKDEPVKTEPEQNRPTAVEQVIPFSETILSETKEEEPETAEEEKSKFRKAVDKLQKKIQTILQKIRGIFKKVIGFPKRMVEKGKEILAFLSELFRKKGLIKEFLEDEICRAAFGASFHDIRRFLKHIRPRKLKGSILFGTGEPESTGTILALAAIFYPIYGNHVTITPDFQEKRFAAELMFRGRVRFFTLARYGIHLLFEKNFKQMRKQFRKLQNDLKKKAA